MKQSFETASSQIARSAWLEGVGEIKVEFKKRLWSVTGTSGNPTSGKITDELYVTIGGLNMHLVSIRRLGRIFRRPDGLIVPVAVYERCRLPLKPLMSKGRWSLSEFA